MKKNRGITLIALVITIVVLVVLVAVSINVAFGDNGIFQKAKEASSATADQIDYESNRLPELMQAYINENVGNIAGDNNSAPSDFSVTLSSKETNSITVIAKATDLDGEDLTYTLYTKTEDGTYEAKNTLDATASGTEVTLTATGLDQYTTYNYYVAVSDGKKTINSEEESVRTYCPTTICTGPFTTTTTCSNCSGEGKVTVSVRCPGSGVPGEYTFLKHHRSTTAKCPTCGATREKWPGTSYYTYYTLAVRCSSYWTSNCHYDSTQTMTTYDTPLCDNCSKNSPYYGTTSAAVPTHNYTTTQDCSRCDGDGEQVISATCSHGKSDTHYYCEHGDDYTAEVHD